MLKLRCERHYRNLATYNWCTTLQHDVNTSRKRCRRDADIRSSAAARRSVTIGGGGGVSKMSAARRRRRTALVCTGFVCRSAYLSSLHLQSCYTSASVDLNRLIPGRRPSITRLPEFPVDNTRGHRWPRHWMSRLVCDCPLSATERFPSLQHEHGTVCQPKWRHQIPCKPSKPK